MNRQGRVEGRGVARQDRGVHRPGGELLGYRIGHLPPGDPLLVAAEARGRNDGVTIAQMNARATA